MPTQRSRRADEQNTENATEPTTDVVARQEPLRARYRETPEAACITDRAVTIGADLSDPWHGTVKPGSEDHGETWQQGGHRAVGGFHDAPNPGVKWYESP